MRIYKQFIFLQILKICFFPEIHKIKWYVFFLKRTNHIQEKGEFSTVFQI